MQRKAEHCRGPCSAARYALQSPHDSIRRSRRHPGHRPAHSRLAEYEHLSHAVTLDEGRLRDHLFGPRPFAEALLAEDADEVVGYALFFPTYSTFLGRPGLYLEDLFVAPAHRGKGHGKALLTAVAGLAVERGCGRLEWSVLDWNEPAIRFYRSVGAAACGRVDGLPADGRGVGGGRPTACVNEHGRRQVLQLTLVLLVLKLLLQFEQGVSQG